MTKKDIQYKELLRRLREVERVQGLGVELVRDKNKIKIVCGLCLAGLGFATLPLPTGSFIFISVGLSLAVNGGFNIYKYKSNLIQRIKVRVWRLRR